MKEIKIRLSIYRLYYSLFGKPKGYEVTKFCYLNYGKRKEYVVLKATEKTNKPNKIWRQDLNLWETKKRFGFLYEIWKEGRVESKFRLVRL